jgi:addiction module RelB/DinJ family antitoxin
MQKTGTIYARVDAETKRKAKKTLEMLGLSMGDAITVFLKQVVANGGLPFQVVLPKEIRQEMAEQFLAELNSAVTEADKNGWWTTKEVFDML